jgi:hypothetical protein
LFACRVFCCFVAGEICGLCPGTFIVLVLPATGDGLEAEIGRVLSNGRPQRTGNIIAALIKVKQDSNDKCIMVQGLCLVRIRLWLYVICYAKLLPRLCRYSRVPSSAKFCFPRLITQCSYSLGQIQAVLRWTYCKQEGLVFTVIIRAFRLEITDTGRHVQVVLT